MLTVEAKIQKAVILLGSMTSIQDFPKKLGRDTGWLREAAIIDLCDFFDFGETDAESAIDKYIAMADYMRGSDDVVFGKA